MEHVNSDLFVLSDFKIIQDTGDSILILYNEGSVQNILDKQFNVNKLTRMTINT